MTNSENWQDRLVSLRSLRYEAKHIEPWEYGVFSFLKNVGVVPWEVASIAKTKVKLGINPSSVPAGYLASCAYEWDTWGPSQPSDFLKAMEAELHPERRDFIAAILTSLGRTVKA